MSKIMIVSLIRTVYFLRLEAENTRLCLNLSWSRLTVIFLFKIIYLLVFSNVIFLLPSSDFYSQSWLKFMANVRKVGRE